MFNSDSDSDVSDKLVIDEDIQEHEDTFINHLSPTLQSNGNSKSDDVLANRPNMNRQNKKQNKVDENSRSSCKRVKLSNSISSKDYAKLERDNEDLKKQIDIYKTQWMPRPTGDALAYFIETYKILSHDSNNTKEDKQKEEKKLKEICNVLNTNEKNLIACKDATSITKTCRKIVKHIYPDTDQRAEMLVSLIPDEKLTAVQELVKLMHPEQSNTSNFILNNAIGNVFASEKGKKEPKKMKEKHSKSK
ncbi:unnamed protein product [Rotaria sp. Silwood2]|nr:unnamed protein product [Rotaria sp. Silwood2]CAF4324786.1 unnamed protein product [Rotaria sp. Silwood2]